jgi:hypothetical protein
MDDEDVQQPLKYEQQPHLPPPLWAAMAGLVPPSPGYGGAMDAEPAPKRRRRFVLVMDEADGKLVCSKAFLVRKPYVKPTHPGLNDCSMSASSSPIIGSILPGSEEPALGWPAPDPTDLHPVGVPVLR